MAKSSPPPPLEQITDGIISHWRDDKGFGFIRYNPKSSGVFFHISSFAYHHRRPKKGDKVVFIAHKENNRYSARRVVLEEDRDAIEKEYIVDATDVAPHVAEAWIFGILGLFFYATLTYISLPLAIASLIISNLTYLLYSIDKSASLKEKKRRIPEASLHISAMLGGWPGALIARALLRHKTKKVRFIIFFWLSIVINFTALYAIVLFIPEHIEHFNNIIMAFLNISI